MKFTLSTRVQGSPEKVFQGFSEELFLALTPFWVKIKMKQFDGFKVGDRFIFKVTMFGLFAQDWHNKVVDSGTSEDRCYFIDEGVIMPFPFTHWRHEHIIEKKNNMVWIRDALHYHCDYLPLEWIVFPVLWLQFWIRKPIYRRRFK